MGAIIKAIGMVMHYVLEMETTEVSGINTRIFISSTQ